MIFEELSLKGAFLIKPEPHHDERGFFSRSFCKQEFQGRGLIDEYVQSNISYNKKKGTLRGMHYQLPPDQETKIVRCLRGEIYDVIVDIRHKSVTYKRWLAVELTQDNGFSIYIPEGFAHGFLTLSDDSEIVYQMSTFYVAEAASGFRWNDPVFNINFPFPPKIFSEKDMQYDGFLC